MNSWSTEHMVRFSLIYAKDVYFFFRFLFMLRLAGLKSNIQKLL